MSTDLAPAPTTNHRGERGSTWRGGLVLTLAILWIGSLGSLAAIVGYLCWSSRAGAAERRLLRFGLAIAIIGLAITGFLVAAVTGASSS